MDGIFSFIVSNANYAHFIVFALLMLAGFNIPISEDLMIIVSAVIASTLLPENTYLLFLGVFLGAYISDWTAYWIGRKLFHRPFFAKAISTKRLEKIQSFYKRYGMLTLLIGRFIPFGVRNGLFMTAGMGKMNFKKFLLFDGIACLISNTVLFTLTFQLGKNYQLLLPYLKKFNIVLFSVFVVTIITFFCYKRIINKQKVVREKSKDF